jgi:hypothetical protein
MVRFMTKLIGSTPDGAMTIFSPVRIDIPPPVPLTHPYGVSDKMILNNAEAPCRSESQAQARNEYIYTRTSITGTPSVAEKPCRLSTRSSYMSIWTCVGRFASSKIRVVYRHVLFMGVPVIDVRLLCYRGCMHLQHGNDPQKVKFMRSS